MNKQWVQTNYQFKPRMATLLISSRGLLTITRARGNALDLRGMDEDTKPEEIEQVVLDIVEELRPDLSGCCIEAICYNLAPMCWEFVVSHRSLPPIETRYAYHSALPRQDLISGEWFPGDSPTERAEQLKKEQEALEANRRATQSTTGDKQ